MFNFFGSKPTPKEQQRENDRALRKVNRDIDRERRQLEREEKKLELEIKKLAKEGNHEGCKMLAKQLVQLRKQKTRTYAANSKIQSIGFHNKAMGANMTLANAMNTSAKTMKDVNMLMKPEQVQSDMRAFGEASYRMQLTDEMINNTLDDILDESGDEEESEQVVNKVLDEIGIEISGKMARVPSGLPTDEEIERVLAQSKSSMLKN